MEHLGHSPTDICKQIGISYNQKPTERINLSGEELESLWTVCSAVADSAEIGFHLGQYLNIESLGTLGMMLQNVSKVGQAIDVAINFIPQVSAFLNVQPKMTDTSFFISIFPEETFQSRFPARSKQACLLAVSLTIKMYSVLTTRTPRLKYAAMPSEVRDRTLLSYCYPHELDYHSSNYIVACKPGFVDIPIVFANASVQPIIAKIMQHELNENNKYWTSKVEDELYRNPSKSMLSDIASALGMSGRSLQRNLQNEHMKFQGIQKRFKTNFAKGLLSQSLQPKEVADQLGYNDVSSFYKAFKKWTGQTVHDYINSK